MITGESLNFKGIFKRKYASLLKRYKVLKSEFLPMILLLRLAIRGIALSCRNLLGFVISVGRLFQGTREGMQKIF